jgi:hypothetical protein
MKNWLLKFAENLGLMTLGAALAAIAILLILALGGWGIIIDAVLVIAGATTVEIFASRI